MKVRIEFEKNLVEEEVIIKCSSMNKNVQELQEVISELTNEMPRIAFFKDNKEIYLTPNEIIFFETSENIVYAHTEAEVYRVKYRLYELEGILPSNFMRISKSAIINVDKVYSIERGITSPSLVQFYKSHKHVYASRQYYKVLRDGIKERRNYEK